MRYRNPHSWFDGPARIRLTYRGPFSRTVQLVLVRLTAILALLFSVLAAQAAPRLGASRALRILDMTGRPLDGDLQEPAAAPDGSLYFTRLWAGTSNLWRATPDAADRSRYPAWKAVPLTRFDSPRFASHPLPLPDGRGLVFETNVTNPSGAGATVTQIARLDLRTGSVTPVTSGLYRYEDPAVAPDGSALAYTSDRAGFQAVYIQSLDAPGESARRIALRARRPVFLPDGSLLFENLRPLSTGLYRLAAPGNLLAVPDLFSSLAGEAAAAPDSSLMLLSAASDASTGKQLYALAIDGSGLRAVPGTGGARRPVFAADSRTAFFDAPASDAPGAARAVWMVPLLRDAPMARLLEIRPASEGALSIIGTLAGESATAVLEVGAGDNPRRWNSIPVALPPVTEAPIALWAPGNARGLYTLRLSVTDVSGETMQALMAVNLPLGAPVAMPRIPASDPPAQVRPTPPPFVPEVINPRSVPPRPVVPVIPRPTPEPIVNPLPAAPNPTPTPYPLPVLPANPPGRQPGTGSLLPSMPLPSFPLGTRPAPTPIPTPVPTPRLTPTPQRTPAPTPTPVGGDAGDLNVSGTLAAMSPGQTSTVSVWVKNTGSRVWPAGQAGQLSGAIRFVARWVDFDSGQRRKWAYNWLRGDVPPGGTSRWDVELKAPSRPGRYKVIYSLIRLPQGEFVPPPYNASQDRWPGEFAAIAFAVNVK